MSRQLQDEEIIIGHRIKPLTRYERRIQSDRDFMEKQRLKERHENFEKYEDPAVIADEGVDEHTRFGESVEEIERNRRREERERKEMFWEARSRKADERERARNEFERQKLIAEQTRLENLRKKGNIKNESGIPYNILTYDYKDNEVGRYLKQSDEASLRAIDQRREELAKRGGLGYNLITGEKYKLLENKPPLENKYVIEPKRELPPSITKNIIDEPIQLFSQSRTNNLNQPDDISNRDSKDNKNNNSEEIYSRKTYNKTSYNTEDDKNNNGYIPTCNRQSDNNNIYRRNTRIINSSNSNNYY